MSISTTSGAQRRGGLDGLGTVGRLADDLDVALGARGSCGSRSRTSAWSSAIRTRIVVRLRAAAGARAPRSRRSARPGVERAAVERDALAHPDEAVAAAVGRAARAGPSSRPRARAPSAAVADGDLGAPAPPGVLERVRERLLHDPVRGQVDARRQRHAARPRCAARPAARPRDLLDERVEPASPGCGASASSSSPRRAAPRAGAAARRAPRGRSPRSPRAPRASRSGSASSIARPPRLHDHHADVVRDDVVQLARDPCALLGDGRRGTCSRSRSSSSVRSASSPTSSRHRRTMRPANHAMAQKKGAGTTLPGSRPAGSATPTQTSAPVRAIVTPMRWCGCSCAQRSSTRRAARKGTPRTCTRRLCRDPGARRSGRANRRSQRRASRVDSSGEAPGARMWRGLPPTRARADR